MAHLSRQSGSARTTLLGTLFIVLLSACNVEMPKAGETHLGDTNMLFGFTAFPYDFTAEAVNRVHEIILPNSNFYALHFDQCLPWKAALTGGDFPDWMERDWDDIVSRIPSTHTVYVAVTPTAVDRVSLAASCTDTEGEDGDLPRELRGASMDHPLVKKAYVAYIQRVINKFRPKFVNIGIELGDMALRYPDKWPAWAHLYEHSLKALKRNNPGLQVGMEFVLQSMLLDRVAKMVKPVVEMSDYVGISFYPYGGSYGEKFGAPALPEGAASWREPFDWLRKYTDKPIAICETGYITRNINLPSYDIKMRGNTDLQTEYVRDLIRVAHRDNYEFVVWFVPVDYERLLERLPDGGGDWKKIWVNAGFFDRDLKVKPAWKAWQQFPHRPANLTWDTSKTRATPVARLSSKSKGKALDLSGGDGLFKSTRGGKTTYDSNASAMRWDLNYDGDWILAERPLDNGFATGTTGIRLKLRSDREDYILLRIEEHSGEAFYVLANAPKTGQNHSFQWDSFDLDPSNRDNGRLDPENIVKVVLADGAAADGADGKRKIWVSDIELF